MGSLPTHENSRSWGLAVEANMPDSSFRQEPASSDAQAENLPSASGFLEGVRIATCNVDESESAVKRRN